MAIYNQSAGSRIKFHFLLKEFEKACKSWKGVREPTKNNQPNKKTQPNKKYFPWEKLLSELI